MPRSDILKLTERLSKASEKIAGNSWITLQDKQTEEAAGKGDVKEKKVGRTLYDAASESEEREIYKLCRGCKGYINGNVRSIPIEEARYTRYKRDYTAM